MLIPATAVAWADDRVAVVLRHELAHVRRGDWLVQLAGELLRILTGSTRSPGSCARGCAARASGLRRRSAQTGAFTPRLRHPSVGRHPPLCPSARRGCRLRRWRDVTTGEEIRRHVEYTCDPDAGDGMVQGDDGSAPACGDRCLPPRRAAPCQLTGSRSRTRRARPSPKSRSCSRTPRTAAKLEVKSHQARTVLRSCRCPPPATPSKRRCRGSRRAETTIPSSGKAVKSGSCALARRASGDRQHSLNSRIEGSGPGKSQPRRADPIVPGLQRDIEACKAVRGWTRPAATQDQGRHADLSRQLSDAGIGGQVKLRATIADRWDGQGLQSPQVDKPGDRQRGNGGGPEVAVRRHAAQLPADRGHDERQPRLRHQSAQLEKF